MQKLFTSLKVLCLAGILTTVSCSNEVDLTANGAENINAGTSTGDYWPLAINNEWNFEGTGSYSDTQIKFTSTSSYDGKTFYMTDGSVQGSEFSGATAQSGIAKVGATYFAYSPGVSIDMGGISTSISPMLITMFKDDLAVGESATSESEITTSISGGPIEVPDTTILNVYTCTMEEQGVTMDVNGVSYSDVIKIKLTVGAENGGQVIEQDYYYYYAKDIGPIKIETTGSYAGTLELESYIVN